jgi:hypothetical protein
VIAPGCSTRVAALLSQALPAAWRNSPEEGERRARRLAELAQTAFAEMRALLRELQPPARERHVDFAAGAQFPPTWSVCATAASARRCRACSIR